MISPENVRRRVRCFVRVRPFISSLDGSCRESAVSTLNGSDQHHAIKDIRLLIPSRPSIIQREGKANETTHEEVHLRFDHVFPPQRIATNSMLSCLVAPTVSDILLQRCTSVMLYGRTGGGKSYTANQILPIFVETLLKSMVEIPAGDLRPKEALGKKKEGSYRWALWVQCCELYMETFHDLLHVSSNRLTSDLLTRGGNTAASPHDLPLCEANPNDKAKLSVCHSVKTSANMYVTGLTAVLIQNLDDFAAAWRIAQANRAVASTGSNARSSRSHCIVTFDLWQVPVTDETVADNNASLSVLHNVPKLHGRARFVDLAGSERLKISGSEGWRQVEAQSTNLSLCTLGKVMHSLAARSQTPAGQAIHVPFRDSKLTRLLQDSLGGSGTSTIVICISPAMNQISETRRALDFGQRAMEITAKAKTIQTTNFWVASGPHQQEHSFEKKLLMLKRGEVPWPLGARWTPVCEIVNAEGSIETPQRSVSQERTFHVASPTGKPLNAKERCPSPVDIPVLGESEMVLMSLPRRAASAHTPKIPSPLSPRSIVFPTDKVAVTPSSNSPSSSSSSSSCATSSTSPESSPRETQLIECHALIDSLQRKIHHHEEEAQLQVQQIISLTKALAEEQNKTQQELRDQEQRYTKLLRELKTHTEQDLVVVKAETASELMATVNENERLRQALEELENELIAVRKQSGAEGERLRLVIEHEAAERKHMCMQIRDLSEEITLLRNDCGTAEAKSLVLEGVLEQEKNDHFLHMLSCFEEVCRWKLHDAEVEERLATFQLQKRPTVRRASTCEVSEQTTSAEPDSDLLKLIESERACIEALNLEIEQLKSLHRAEKGLWDQEKRNFQSQRKSTCSRTVQVNTSCDIEKYLPEDMSFCRKSAKNMLSDASEQCSGEEFNCCSCSEMVSKLQRQLAAARAPLRRAKAANETRISLLTTNRHQLESAAAVLNQIHASIASDSNRHRDAGTSTVELQRLLSFTFGTQTTSCTPIVEEQEQQCDAIDTAETPVGPSMLAATCCVSTQVCPQKKKHRRKHFEDKSCDNFIETVEIGVATDTQKTCHSSVNFCPVTKVEAVQAVPITRSVAVSTLNSPTTQSVTGSSQTITSEFSTCGIQVNLSQTSSQSKLSQTHLLEVLHQSCEVNDTAFLLPGWKYVLQRKVEQLFTDNAMMTDSCSGTRQDNGTTISLSPSDVTRYSKGTICDEVLKVSASTQSRLRQTNDQETIVDYPLTRACGTSTVSHTCLTRSSQTELLPNHNVGTYCQRDADPLERLTVLQNEQNTRFTIGWEFAEERHSLLKNFFASTTSIIRSAEHRRAKKQIAKKVRETHVSSFASGLTVGERFEKSRHEMIHEALHFRRNLEEQEHTERMDLLSHQFALQDAQASEERALEWSQMMFAVRQQVEKHELMKSDKYGPPPQENRDKTCLEPEYQMSRGKKIEQNETVLLRLLILNHEQLLQDAQNAAEKERSGRLLAEADLVTLQCQLSRTSDAESNRNVTAADFGVAPEVNQAENEITSAQLTCNTEVALVVEPDISKEPSLPHPSIEVEAKLILEHAQAAYHEAVDCLQWHHDIMLTHSQEVSWVSPDGDASSILDDSRRCNYCGHLSSSAASSESSVRGRHDDAHVSDQPSPPESINTPRRQLRYSPLHADKTKLTQNPQTERKVVVQEPLKITTAKAHFCSAPAQALCQQRSNAVDERLGQHNDTATPPPLFFAGSRLEFPSPSLLHEPRRIFCDDSRYGKPERIHDRLYSYYPETTTGILLRSVFHKAAAPL